MPPAAGLGLGRTFLPVAVQAFRLVRLALRYQAATSFIIFFFRVLQHVYALTRACLLLGSGCLSLLRAVLLARRNRDFWCAEAVAVLQMVCLCRQPPRDAAGVVPCAGAGL